MVPAFSTLAIRSFTPTMALELSSRSAAGPWSVRLGLRGIPSCSEGVMVARDILLAQLTGARFHVAHISTRNAMAMVAYAKQQGLPVTCEATPHHFALTDAQMLPYDSNFKMKPPLRTACD